MNNLAYIVRGIKILFNHKQNKMLVQGCHYRICTLNVCHLVWKPRADITIYDQDQEPNPIRNISLTLNSRRRLMVLMFCILLSSQIKIRNDICVKNEISTLDSSTVLFIGIFKYAKVNIRNRNWNVCPQLYNYYGIYIMCLNLDVCNLSEHLIYFNGDQYVLIPHQLTTPLNRFCFL